MLENDPDENVKKIALENDGVTSEPVISEFAEQPDKTDGPYEHTMNDLGL